MFLEIDSLQLGLSLDSGGKLPVKRTFARSYLGIVSLIKLSGCETWSSISRICTSVGHAGQTEQL